MDRAAPLANGPPQPAAAAQARPREGERSEGGPLKKARTAAECVKELVDMKQLLDHGVLSPEEFTDLKARLLRGD